MNFKRGSILLAGAWAVLMIAGYVLNVWLAYVFDKKVYGDYIIVISVLLWLEIIVLNGMPYTIQKFIGAEPSRVHGIFWTAFRLQLMVTIGLFLISFISAPVLARMFKAPHYTNLFRIAFCDIPVYGFYHLYVGYKNGLQKFGQQSVLIILYSITKVGTGILLVLVTHSIVAALVSNIIASAGGLVLGIFYFEKSKKQVPYAPGVMIKFALPSLSFQLLLNLLFYVDLWIVNYFHTSSGSAEYGIAGFLARAPYFLFLGVSISLLPALSQAFKEKDTAQTRSLTVQAIHFLWMVTMPVGFLMTFFGPEIVGFLFPNAFLNAGPVLSVLVWGMIALTFIMLLSTILMADHKPGIAFLMMSIIVSIDLTMNLILVPAKGIIGGAIATTLSCGTGLLLLLGYIVRSYQIRLPWLSLGRMLLTGCGVAFLANFFKTENFWIIPLLLGGMILYAAFLFLSRELSMQDLREVFGIGHGSES